MCLMVRDVSNKNPAQVTTMKLTRQEGLLQEKLELWSTGNRGLDPGLKESVERRDEGRVQTGEEM